MRPWFRAKTYGWGWYPATWQGWLILAAFIFLIVKILTENSDMLIKSLPQTIILIVILTVICYLTGEKPRWRWGKN